MLEKWAHAGTSTVRLARRCQVIPLAAQGLPNRAIARQTGISRPTVLAIRNRFKAGGVEALRRDRQRHLSRRRVTPELEQRVLDLTLQTRPPDATPWSPRRLVRELGMARMSVRRVWQRHDLQPHRVEKFKLSNDPHFEEKVRDAVGLYLNPPYRALVLCVDEKSQIQALNRTAPLLPLRPGLLGRQTHDYKRHGTTTQFAAYNILTGKVIGQCLPRHRGREFAKFLGQVENEVPPELDAHLIIDNYSTHQSPRSSAGSSPRSVILFRTVGGTVDSQVQLTTSFTRLDNPGLSRSISSAKLFRASSAEAKSRSRPNFSNRSADLNAAPLVKLPSEPFKV